MSVLGLYFGWPAGAVYSNLIASVICVGVAWWKLHAQAITHHLERLAQAERLHRELREHVTAATAPRPAARRAKTLATEPPRKAAP